MSVSSPGTAILPWPPTNRFGDSFAQRIQGDFAVAIFNRRTDRLLLARDRLGLRPLCYSDGNGGTFLFGSEAKAILAYPGMTAGPDNVMLADFVLYFRAADAPGSNLLQRHSVIARGARPDRDAKRHDGAAVFDFDTTRQTRLSASATIGEAFRHLFAAAVRKRLRCARPVAISVSGGLDSAYIYCVAHRAMRDGPDSARAFSASTTRVRRARPSEEKCVLALEEASGTPIDRMPQRAGFMASAGDEVWHSESPIVEGLACQGQAVLRRVSESGAQRGS